MNQKSDQSTAAIQIEGVWKIFGDRAFEAMAAIEKGGITKQQALEALRLCDRGRRCQPKD